MNLQLPAVIGLVLVGSCASSIAQQALSSGPDFSQARKFIRQQVGEGKVPSITVTVAQHGHILWEEGFGWADRENHVRATPDTAYYTASVSKTITATALMVLAEKKKLALDHAVNEYLGSAQLSSPVWDTTQATVQRVATHTAGLATYDAACSARDHGCYLSEDETIQRYGVIVWPPGDHFDYSNLDYEILGDIIERVSHKSYQGFLRDEIFQPLGMTHCSLDKNPRQKNTAARYDSGEGGKSTVQQGKPGSGASSVYCSAHDLALFAMFHLKDHLHEQKQILSGPSIDAMQMSSVALGNRQSYGLSWSINDDLYGYRGVLAQGGTNDAQAWVQMVPSEDLAVVVLSNRGDADAQTIIYEILSTLLPNLHERQPASGNKQAPSQASPAETPASLLGSWSGTIRTYNGNIPLALSVSDAGKVQTQIGPAGPMEWSRSRLTNARLFGVTTGDLGTKDPGVAPYELHFELYVHADKLYGAVTTYPKSGGRFSYWVGLTKKTASAENTN